MPCVLSKSCPGSLFIACGDPLVAPELITGNRVLAARTEATVDPHRASVMPAESARVRWLLAAPDGAPSLGRGFSACVAEATSRGLPICAGAPFARLVSSDTSAEEPRFDFAVPDSTTLGGATQIAVNGVFCASGAPSLAPSGVDFAKSPCPDPLDQPLFATLDVQVTSNTTANANPDFAGVPIQFDGADWAALNEATASASGCSNTALGAPHVAANGATHTLSFAIPDEMSEPLPKITSLSAARETLTLGHFVTSGSLERAYSDVDVATNPAVARVSWQAPLSTVPEGTLVRFYFVLRDGRGGADFAERAVCATL